MAKVKAIGGDRFWPAVPEDVVDYILLRRATRVVATKPPSYEVEVNFPVGIRKRRLSFKLEDPERKAKRVLYDGKAQILHRYNEAIIFTVEEVHRANDDKKHRIDIV